MGRVKKNCELQGKKMGVGVSIIVFISIIVMLCSSWITQSVLAAILPSTNGSYTYYTKDNNNIILPIDKVVEGATFVVFTKDTETQKCNMVDYIEVTKDSTSVALNGNWGQGDTNRYYVGTTQLSETEMYIYADSVAIESGNEVTLANLNGDTLELQVVKVIYDSQAPEFSAVSLSPGDVVYDDSEIEILFSTNEKIEISSMNIFDKSVTPELKELEERDNIFKWKVTYKMLSGNGLELKEDAKCQCSIVIKDLAGNLKTITDLSTKSTPLYKIIKPTVSVFTSSNRNPKYAKKDDVITLKVNFNKEVKVNNEVIILGKTITVNPDNLFKKEWEFTYTLGGSESDGLATFQMGGVDAVNNKVLVTQENATTTVMVDNTAPVISEISFTSNDLDYNKMVCNDVGRSTITLQFQASEKINPKVELFSKEGADQNIKSIGILTTIESEPTVTNKNFVYNSTYTFDALNQPEEINTYVYYKIIASDFVGNEMTSIASFDERISYSRRIITSGDLLELSVNSIDKNGTFYAKNDTDILVKFKLPNDKAIRLKDKKNPSKLLLRNEDKQKEISLSKGNDGYYTATYSMTDDLALDGETISLSLKLIPVIGCENTILLPNQIQYVAPLTLDLNYTSNNAEGKNPLFAKNNDTITVNINANHAVNVSNTTIAGKEITFTSSEDKKKWTGTYVIQPDKILDNTNVNFTSTVADIVDQTQTVTQETVGSDKQIKYYEPIEITNLGYGSDYINEHNKNVKTMAKDGNIITVKFNTQHEVAISNASIAGVSVTFTSEDKKKWTGTYTIQTGVIEDLSNIKFAFTATDQANNTITGTESNTKDKVKYFAPLAVTDLRFVSDNSVPGYAINGNQVKVTFQTTHAAQIEKASIAGQEVTFTSDEKKQEWTGTFELVNGVVLDNREVPFTFMATDGCNIGVSKNEESVPEIIYYAPLTSATSNLSFVSNNDTTAHIYAKKGDTVALSFRTSHPVSLSDYSVAGQTISFSSTNNDGMNWSTSYVVKEDVITDNTDIAFQFTMRDVAGNPAVTKTQEDTAKVRYQAPLVGSISNLSFESNNANSSAYAKDGQVVTVAFKTTHPVKLSETSIAGKDVKFASKESDGMNWSASYKVEKADLSDNSDITFALTVKDAAGNEAVSKSEKNTTKVRYQAPIQIIDLKMVSNNVKGKQAIAKDGDTITATFSSTHPLNLTAAMIAGKKVTFQSENNQKMNWTATYQVKNGQIEDNETVKLGFDANDVAGNTAVVVTEGSTITEKVKYYAPMQISKVVITTNNSKDKSKYAKDGDTVIVKFTTNHDVTLSTALIAGSGVTQTKKGNQEKAIAKDWTISYQLKNKDVVDLAKVVFYFAIEDVAGNTQQSKKESDKEVTNSIQYFAPMEAKTSITSTAKNASFAKKGDTITVTSKPNHNATVAAATIFARNTSNAGNDSMELKMAYTIPTGENQLAQGVVPFSYEIIDLAGNKLKVNKINEGAVPQITYDSINPSITSSTDFSGFTNETSAYTLTFEDVNLDRNGVSIKVNGEEQITSEERNAMTGTTFSKTVTLSKEDAYAVIGSIVDKAGNQSAPDFKAKITVDKTNPAITSTKIDMAVPKAYQTGFVISEFFQLTDQNFKEVICTVTDGKSVTDWDIETPITTEGKKTIFLMVTDMAGNKSNAVTYDLYIDATQPKPILKDAISGVELVSGSNTEPFISDMSLEISLAALQMGDEKPDHFTTLKLVDEKGNLVTDILATVAPTEEGVYKVEPKEFGVYTVIAKAADDVGNQMGSMEYSFAFTDMPMIQKYYENKPLFYSSASIFAVLLFGVVPGVVWKRKKMSIKVKK